MKNGAMTAQESSEMTRRRIFPNALDTTDLDLSWDGVDQCRTAVVGALKFHIDTLRDRTSDTGDDGKGLHFLVWLIEEQTDRIDSFLERLCEAMKKENIKLEG